MIFCSRIIAWCLEDTSTTKSSSSARANGHATQLVGLRLRPPACCAVPPVRGRCGRADYLTTSRLATTPTLLLPPSQVLEGLDVCFCFSSFSLCRSPVCKYLAGHGRSLPGLAVFSPSLALSWPGPAAWPGLALPGLARRLPAHPGHACLFLSPHGTVRFVGCAWNEDVNGGRVL